MHLLASAVVTIACSRAKAFDYAANLVNFADWFPGVNSVAAHNELPFATAGKQYVETAAMPLRGKRSVLIRVIDARAPHRVITEGTWHRCCPAWRSSSETSHRTTVKSVGAC